MDVKKILIIVSIAFVLFASVLGGVYFYISRTLTAEKVRTVLIETLTTTFPNAQVHVGEVDFHFGTSISFVISQIEVKKDAPIFSLADTRLRIPVWAILKGGGVVEVEVNSPKINWIQKENANNWQGAMVAKEVKDAKPESESSPSKMILALPAFLQASRLNLKMRDSVISYNLDGTQKGEIIVSKFLVKELGFDNPAAFEIDTKLYIVQENEEFISAKTLVIGELDFQRFLTDEILAAIMVVNVSEIKMSKLEGMRLPDLRADIRTEIDRESTIKGSLKTTFLNSSISLNFEKKNDLTQIGQLNAQIPVSDLLQISAQNIEGLIPGKTSLALSGEVALEKSQIKPNLTFTLAPALSYAVKKDVPVQVNAKGTWSVNDLDISIPVSVFQGEIQNNLKAHIPVSSGFDLARMEPLKLTTVLTNIQITQSNIEALAAKKTNEGAAAKKEGEEKKEVPPFFLPLKWDLSFENGQVLDQKITGSGRLDINRDAHVKMNTDFAIGKGKVKKQLAMNLLPQIKGTLDVNVDGLNGNIVNPFLPNGSGQVKGDFDLKLNGDFAQEKEELTYKMNFNTKITNGRVEKIDPSLWLNDLLSGLGSLTPKAKELASKVKIEPDFSHLSAQGSATSELISLKSFSFKGIKDKFELKGDGKISLEEQKNSLLNIQYRDHDGNVSAFLKREVGTEILPLKLEGKGFDLKPDVDFTLKKLSGLYLKNKGKKIQQKGLKDAAEKLLKGDEGKKINKLIQGIFQ